MVVLSSSRLITEIPHCLQSAAFEHLRVDRSAGEDRRPSKVRMKRPSSGYLLLKYSYKLNSCIQYYYTVTTLLDCMKLTILLHLFNCKFKVFGLYSSK